MVVCEHGVLAWLYDFTNDCMTLLAKLNKPKVIQAHTV